MGVDPKDYKLVSPFRGDIAPQRENEEMVMATRMVVSAALQPGGRLTASQVAQVTGLSDATVDHILKSPLYKALLRDACLDQVSVFMGRSIGILTKIAENEEMSPTVRMNAVRTGIQMYTALNRDGQKDDGDDAILNLEAFLSKMEKKNQLRRVNAKPIDQD